MSNTRYLINIGFATVLAAGCGAKVETGRNHSPEDWPQEAQPLPESEPGDGSPNAGPGQNQNLIANTSCFSNTG